jgi:hypothetical protein
LEDKDSTEGELDKRLEDEDSIEGLLRRLLCLPLGSCLGILALAGQGKYNKGKRERPAQGKVLAQVENEDEEAAFGSE